MKPEGSDRSHCHCYSGTHDQYAEELRYQEDEFSGKFELELRWKTLPATAALSEGRATAYTTIFKHL